MSVPVYMSGSLVTTTARFFDETGALADPTTVVLKYKKAAGATGFCPPRRQGPGMDIRAPFSSFQPPTGRHDGVNGPEENVHRAPAIVQTTISGGRILMKLCLHQDGGLLGSPLLKKSGSLWQDFVN
jgi:hypothetical protein